MPTVRTARAGAYRRRRSIGPALDRPWKVWDLDAELRYLPVVDALPASPLPIVEIGSGITGLAAWTDRPVYGVDPGDDDRHGSAERPGNMQRLQGDGAHVPLPDGSASATVAVDTFEHIPPAARQSVVDEMVRVTADGGRVVIIGPTGSAARDNDLKVLARAREIGADHIVVWLAEHFENGLPEQDELVALFGSERVESVEVTWLFNTWFHWWMHSASGGRPREPWPLHRVHHLIWWPFATLARRFHRGKRYRCMVVAQLAPAAA